MMRKQLVKRYLVLAIGIYFCALGVALITKSGLGTSPISSLAYVLTFLFPLSLGTFTFLSNCVMLLGQVAILGRDFKPFQILQLPVTFFFSVFIDLNMYVLSGLTLPNYFSQLGILVLGSASLGFGVALEVVSHTLILPADGLATALVQRFGMPFERAKVSCDMGMLILACILSLVTMGNISGIREGTLIAALTIGLFAGVFKKRIAP